MTNSTEKLQFQLDQVERVMRHLDAEFRIGLHGSDLSELLRIVSSGESDGDRRKMSSDAPDGLPAGPMQVLSRIALQAGLVVHPVCLPIEKLLWLPRRELALVVVGADGEMRVVHQRRWFRSWVWNTETSEGTWLRRGGLRRCLGCATAEPIHGLLLGPGLAADELRGNAQSALHPSMGVRRGESMDSPVKHAANTLHDHPSPLSRLIGLLRPERGDIGAIVLFSLLAGILYLAVPLAVDAVVSNIAFGGQDRPYFQALLTVSVLLFAFLGLLAVIRTFQHYLAEVLQRRIFLRLTADISFRLPRVRQDALDGIHAPELVNRFFDTLTVQKSSSLILLEGVNLVLSTLIGLTVLAIYHPFLLAYSLGLIGFVGLILYPGGIGAVKTSIRESVAKYAVAGWLEQLATYPTLFKNPGGARYAMARANGFALEYLQARKDHFQILIRQIAALFLLQALAGAILLVLGGFLVLRGELTLGQLVASELIVGAVVAALAKLGKQLEAWYDALAAVDKLGYLVDLPIESTLGESGPSFGKAVQLSARKLSFGYVGGKRLFEQIEFQIEPGERIGIVGADGSGASSLLDLMYGIRYPQDGQLIADGLDLHHWDKGAWRDQVVLVRGHEIVDGTIVENLRLARPLATIQEMHEALMKVQLLDEILSLPDGLQTQLLLGGRPLAGSQRTRLTLARAWLARPRLLLLDLAIDGLDSALRNRVIDPLFDPAQTWTVIVVSRESSILRRCHRIYRIDTPNLRSLGSFDEMERSGV